MQARTLLIWSFPQQQRITNLNVNKGGIASAGCSRWHSHKNIQKRLPCGNRGHFPPFFISGTLGSATNLLIRGTFLTIYRATYKIFPEKNVFSLRFGLAVGI
ncbi:MAG: hypothetical protein GX594_11925 [Pirellulaceae bacterium]|nr:hypothetical protein [Pirellulaceae bacterium]